MPAVLLRIARLDALDRDPQTQPPNRELAQAKESMGVGKRYAVVGTDGGGES